MAAAHFLHGPLQGVAGIAPGRGSVAVIVFRDQPVQILLHPHQILLHDLENGVIKQYFVNSYMSAKMGIEPTVEDISRPCLLPIGEKELSLEDLLHMSGSGILVTGFNGGNCNPVTGDFSFGIEGFAFSKGKITHPVREMLITGNILELWNNLTAVGSDARPCVRWQIGSLAFENVSFSA